MKLRLKATLIALTIAAIAAIAWAASRGAAIEVVPVVQGPMVQSVVMSGRIATAARAEIASQATARIESVLVREGDRVKAGQVLVRLRDDEAHAALEQATAAVAQARARLQEIQTIAAPVSQQQLEQARAGDVQAQAEWLRAQDLVRQGFVSQSRVEEAARAARASAATLRAAQAQAQGNTSQGASTQLAQAALQQVLAAQRAAAARLDQLSLRAPLDGTVIARTADPGDTAQSGKVLLTLTHGEPTRIEASVDEKNLKYLTLGQTATAIADAFTEARFAARLSYIAPAVDAQRGTVAIRLTVEPAQAFLRPDMTVSVEIVTGQRASTLMVPTDTLRRGADGKPYVLVNAGGTARRVEVSTGLLGTGTTEITQGLQAGDRVIAPGSLIQDGSRVRETSLRSPKGNAPQVPGLTG